MAPVQGYAQGIPWSMHLEAYDVYCKRYGKQEELVQGSCRGGFGVNELDVFIPGWRDKLSEITALRASVDSAHAVLERLSDYQHVYSHYAHGCDMPGNDLYSGILIQIVRDARAILGPGSEVPLTAGEMQEILYAGYAALKDGS